MYFFLERVKIEDDITGNCTCETYKSCRWAQEAVIDIAEIIFNQKEDPSGKEKAEFFQNRICDKRTQSVYCCDNQTPPSNKRLKILNAPRVENDYDIGISENYTSESTTYPPKHYAKAHPVPELLNQDEVKSK